MAWLKKPEKMWVFTKMVQSWKNPSMAVKTNFFRLMAVGQRAGMGLRDTLKGILASEQNERMKDIVRDILAQVNEWVSLGQSLYTHQEFFEADERELIKSAEQMGNLPETLNEVSNELENRQKIMSKITSSLSYPAALIVFTIAAVAILLIKVIPTITSLFPDQSQLPEVTKFMIGSSDFLIETRPLLLTIGIGTVIGVRLLYGGLLTFKKFVDGMMIRIPVLKDVTKTFYMYRFSKLMGDFTHAWVSPIDALSQMTEIFENYYYKRKCLQMKNDLAAGFSFADAIEGSSLFDPVLVQIIIVWENTGNVGDVLITMANFYRDALKNKIDWLMWVLEPVLMGIIASVIGTVVASIFLPLADLVNVLGA